MFYILSRKAINETYGYNMRMRVTLQFEIRTQKWRTPQHWQRKERKVGHLCLFRRISNERIVRMRQLGDNLEDTDIFRKREKPLKTDIEVATLLIDL